jgi:Predicted DNA-binding protein with PD1-like DNA-binding motif
VLALRSFLFRVPEGLELLEYLAGFAERHGIGKAYISAIGSFSEATVAYYSFEEQRYVPIEVRERVELLSATGNISLLNNKPFPHVHVVLGRKDGSTVGGHLLRGVVVLAEVYVQEVAGGVLERRPWKHGLTAWDIEG